MRAATHQLSLVDVAASSGRLRNRMLRQSRSGDFTLQCMSPASGSNGLHLWRNSVVLLLVTFGVDGKVSGRCQHSSGHIL